MGAVVSVLNVNWPSNFVFQISTKWAHLQSCKYGNMHLLHSFTITTLPLLSRLCICLMHTPGKLLRCPVNPASAFVTMFHVANFVLHARLFFTGYWRTSILMPSRCMFPAGFRLWTTEVCLALPITIPGPVSQGEKVMQETRVWSPPYLVSSTRCCQA